MEVGLEVITWHEIISVMASQEKPFFIATGASSMNEVHAAVEVARVHTDKLCLMQCNTNYTGSTENFRHIELNVIRTYASYFPKLSSACRTILRGM